MDCAVDVGNRSSDYVLMKTQEQIYDHEPLEEIVSLDRLSELLDRVDYCGPNGCWVWRGGKSGEYGMFPPFQGKGNVHTHVLFFRIQKGRIPEGLHLDHLCRNGLCCNPKHLEAVTCRTNILRGIGPAAQNAVKTHCLEGHEFDYTYKTRWGVGRGCTICRREAGRRFRAKRKNHESG